MLEQWSIYIYAVLLVIIGFVAGYFTKSRSGKQVTNTDGSVIFENGDEGQDVIRFDFKIELEDFKAKEYIVLQVVNTQK